MKNITLRKSLLALFVLTTFVARSQNVAINTSGNSAVTGAILDLSNNLTTGTTAFLAPYVTLTNSTVLAPVTGAGPAGLLVYNISASTSNGLNGAGYYYWTGSAWVYLSTGAGSTLTGADDGASVNGTNVILGNAYGGTAGKLLQNTEIPFNSFNIDFSGTGSIGIGLAASTTAARELEIGGTSNTIRNNGLKAASTFNATPAATTTYMMYANTNGDEYAMPAGTANQVLTFTATGPSWQTPAATVVGANSGTSLNGTDVILGNAYGGTAGKLLANTEIPFNSFNIDFSGTGTIGIGLAASTTAARELEIGGTSNTIRNNGLKAASTFNATPAATTTYMMYANTNGDEYAMPAGTANQVLTFTATGPSWQTPAATVVGANSGTSLNGTDVILGNAYGGTAGKLLANTEIPFNSFNIDFSGTGTIGIGLAASTTAARELEIGGTSNTIRNNGLKAASTFNATPAATTTYMMYANTNGDEYAMPAGTANQVLTFTATGPSWQTPAATVVGANSGTSLNGTDVILGNAYGGTAGKLLANTEIPFNSFNIDFSGTGSIGIGLAASTTAARELEIGGTSNTIRNNGLKAASTFNATPAATTTYMMYANTNGDEYAMPAGTANQVLTFTATGPSWQTPAAAAVQGANSGTSMNGTDVILGNAYGGTTGKLLANTEIPLNSFNIDFSGTGTIGIDLAASTTAARALEIGGLTNTIRDNGLKAGGTFNANPVSASSYMMYSRDNGDVYGIPAGTTNQVLTFTATGPNWVTPAAATVVGANSGTSLNGTNVILGNAYGGTAGKLLANTEIPFNSFNIDFSGTGSIGIGLAASTTAARELEIGGTTNTIRNNGLKAASTFNATPSATTSYMMYANTNGDEYAMPAGTANQVLTFTATGPAWQAPAAATITANNGAYMSTGSNVQFGTNALVQNTTLPLATFTLLETGSVAGIAHTVTNAAANGYALAGENTAASNVSTGIGVYGTTIQSGGYGVEGTNTNLFGGTGIYGTGTTYGVEGSASGSVGVYGVGSTGVEGNGTAYGLYGIGPVAVYGDANNSTNSAGGYFTNNTGSCYTYLAYYTGATYYGLYTNSNYTALGVKSTIVADKSGDMRSMYCAEAPEVLFEDYGTSQLVNGKVHIDLDPTYAANVNINEKHPLRVIITMNDECPNGVYVTNRTATGFDVVENSHGASNANFTYEVIANRADKKVKAGEDKANYSDYRFEHFDVPPPPKTTGQNKSK